MNGKAVLVILSAGIRNRKLQTAVFAAGCFLCAFFLLGVFVMQFAMEKSFRQAYGKLNAPTMSIRVSETEIEKESLADFLGQLPYVRDYGISKTYLASNVKMPGRKMDFAYLAASLEGCPGGAEEKNAENKKTPQKGRVIVNNAVYDGRIGDEAVLSVNGHTVALCIESIVADPINSAPESRIPYFWVSADELDALTTGYQKGSYMAELKADPSEAAAEQLAQDYAQYFGKPFDGDLVSYGDIQHTYLFRYEIFRPFLLFLSLFLLAIVLVMTVLLSQMAVRSDRKKIGILKSIGFTDSHIDLKYLLQYLLVAAIAGILGVVGSGFLFQGWLGGMFANMGRGLFRIQGLGGYQALVLLLLGGVLYLAVQCSVSRAVKIPPMDAILEKKPARQSKRGGVQWGGVFLPMPRFLQANLGLLKCAQRRFESLFLFFLTLGVASMLLFSSYLIDGVRQANAHLTDWGIAEMDLYVSRKANVDEKKSGLLDALDREAAVDFYYAALSDTVAYRLPGSSLSHNVTGDIYDREIPKGLEYLFVEGRNPQDFGEAAVGINFAKENRLGIGSRFFVTRYGKETELEVVGIYPSYKQYGNSIRFLTEDIKAFFGNQADGYYSIVLQEGEDPQAFAEKMAEDFPDFQFFPMRRSAARSVQMLLPPVAVGASMFLLVYVLILLCLRNIMVAECRKELEICHFIGFTKRKVRALVRWRFQIPILLGAAAAVPLSVYVVPGCLRPLAGQLGLSRLPIYPNGMLVLVPLAGVFLCSLVSGSGGLKKRI